MSLQEFGFLMRDIKKDHIETEIKNLKRPDCQPRVCTYTFRRSIEI